MYISRFEISPNTDIYADIVIADAPRYDRDHIDIADMMKRNDR